MNSSMPYARLLTLAAVLAVLSLAGCGSTREADEAGGAQVEVINRNYVSMEIYVVGQSRRVRLGRVASGKTQRFTIPVSLLSGATPLRFVMEPSGPERDILSEEFVVVPGEEVILVIPNQR